MTLKQINTHLQTKTGGATSLDLAGFKADILEVRHLCRHAKSYCIKRWSWQNVLNGGGAAKTITRAQFDAMNPNQRAEHFKNGGTITN